MSKKNQSSEIDTGTDASDEDKIEFKHEASSDITQSTDDTLSDKEQTPVQEAATEREIIPPQPAEHKPRRRIALLLAILNFLLIIGLIVVAFYYWQLQQKAETEKQAFIAEIDQKLAKKADTSKINSALSPIKSEMGQVAGKIEQIQGLQKDLKAASEKLYELFGRDENSWKLAEVEYLMRVAQHKLILENDFEGAALTLQAASDKIGATADPGLLPVRVKISQEIANLKTRSRPDLVGMTLLLSQLGRQVYSLNPGFNAITNQMDSGLKQDIQTASDQTMYEQLMQYLSSLVSIKQQQSLPTFTESRVLDIEETLADNLKLTRWALLERDSHQFGKLMKDNLSLFKQYYNLDDAANNDFYRQLLHLEKTVITPQKPNISGSLDLLKQIISQREHAPEQDKSEVANDV